MSQYEHAKWLYEQTWNGDPDERWDQLGPAVHNQWVRLAAFVQNDRKALAKRLSVGLEFIFEGLGHHGTQVVGVGEGFGKIKDVMRELDPKGPIT